MVNVWRPRSRRQGSTRRPDFIIIGAQKGGSTGLARYLGTHPAVFLPPDEIPYFESPFYERTPVEVFDAAFRKTPPTSARVGFQRPDYLGRPECPVRIYNKLGAVDLLVVLRHPVERLVSAYYWYLQLGLIAFRPIEVAIGEWSTMRSSDLDPIPARIFSYSHYGQHLERWMELWDSDRIVVLASRELDDQAVMARVFGHLGVTPISGPPLPARRVNEGVYDPLRLRLLRLRRPFVFSWERADRFTTRSRRLRRPGGMPVVMALKLVDSVLARVRSSSQATALSEQLRADLDGRYAGDCQFVRDHFRVELETAPDLRVAHGEAGLLARRPE